MAYQSSDAWLFPLGIYTLFTLYNSKIVLGFVGEILDNITYNMVYTVRTCHF
jgi:hypothetical protein